jgi:hypothetical protein
MLHPTDVGDLDTSDDWEHWLGMTGFNPEYIVRLSDWIGPFLTVAIKPEF